MAVSIKDSLTQPLYILVAERKVTLTEREEELKDKRLAGL
jgi:hypothetical protein